MKNGNKINILSVEFVVLVIVMLLVVMFLIPLVHASAEQEKLQVMVVDVHENDCLNVRDMPSINGRIISSLSDGAKIEVVATYDGWSLVNFVGYTGVTPEIGWVSTEYLK